MLPRMAARCRFALHLAAPGSAPAIVREEALIANLREADAVARAGLH